MLQDYTKAKLKTIYHTALSQTNIQSDTTDNIEYQNTANSRQASDWDKAQEVNSQIKI
jgi:hypothetical protein